MALADDELVALEQRILDAKTLSARLPSTTRDKVLAAFRDGLLLSEEQILQANRADIEVSVWGPGSAAALLRGLSPLMGELLGIVTRFSKGFLPFF